MADLQAPLDEFLGRTAEIRRIIVAIESVSKNPALVSTTRANVDLKLIGGISTNTVNSMSLVFLGSSFEEFIKQEVEECATHLRNKYPTLPEANKFSIRDHYWKTTLEILGFNKSILMRQQDPKALNPIVISKIKSMIEGALGFVVDDDSQKIQSNTFSHHSRNFKPQVVNDIAKRIGISDLIGLVSEGTGVKNHFGVTKKQDSKIRLTTKLDEFYDRRNQVVHSLNSSAGFGVDAILDYAELLEAVAEATKSSLEKVINKW